MTVVTFPGQGSQKPGFLEPWLRDDAAREKLTKLSAIAGTDLVAHGTTSDAETLRDTAVAQPLIVAAGILVWDALTHSGADLTSVAVAGHSVGEISAAYAAGVFNADVAMQFVTRRAALMAEDAAREETSMAAVLGGEEDAVIAHLESLDLQPANFNGAGQIVAAGTPDALAELRKNPPAGARVIPLKVAGAFHTPWMQHAHDALAAERESFDVTDPERTLYSNRDGSVVDSGAKYLDLLIDQVSRPVRWDKCMAAFDAAGEQTLIEAAPAGTLVGLAKRALKDTSTIAINSPEDLTLAVAALTR